MVRRQQSVISKLQQSAKSILDKIFLKKYFAPVKILFESILKIHSKIHSRNYYSSLFQQKENKQQKKQNKVKTI